MDKQPEMKGWNANLGPWKPVIKEDTLMDRTALTIVMLLLLRSLRLQCYNIFKYISPVALFLWKAEKKAGVRIKTIKNPHRKSEFFYLLRQRLQQLQATMVYDIAAHRYLWRIGN
ncbi:hypothetical protein [Coxiella endosymbiont of Ornithodoros amblus]|uniref:hypothetical protein n=1 Tax=Coxiella endosymbiont of Ornithodoros amblus TaxID=1656166 RepID=UPI00244E3E24|nr:hypothetical protein [Coxiella endosymbiont of Ornithodoros amblus]